MDKNKIIEAAAKLVAKGAYDKAIKEYQKVLDADPKDVRVLQKMGELYQKKNDNDQAALFFTKVAESYSNDGFFLKAVALYKQVLKLNPNLIEVNLKLADLHQQLGLMSEAMGYYQIVANHYDRAGDTKASLDTLKRMVDLDPDNVSSRSKLAELYAREGMNEEAVAEFNRVADYLRRNNRSDDYLRVAERIAALEPENLALSKELAASYLSKGDQKRALAKLQICFKADPRDIETLNLLAQAFQGLGQTSKTLSVYKELAKIYAEKNQTAEANQTWQEIERLDPADADVLARRGASMRPPPSPPRGTTAPASTAARPAATSARPATIAPPPPPSSGTASAMGRDQLVKLLTETDVYVKYGLHDKALEHLRKIFAIDPENLDAHEKAYHIYVGANNQPQAADQLLNVLRLCTRRSDVTRAQPYLATILRQNPHHPEVPAFLAVLRTNEMEVPEEAAEEVVSDDAILVDSSEDDVIVADPPEDVLPTDDDLALANAATDGEEVVHEERLAEPEELDSEPVYGDLEDEPISSDFPVALAEEDADGEIIVQDDEIAAPLIGYGDEPGTLPSVNAFSGFELPMADTTAEFEQPSQLRSLIAQSVPSKSKPTSGPRPPAFVKPAEKAAEVTVRVPTPQPPASKAKAAPPPLRTPEPAKKAPPPPVDEEVAAEELEEAGFFLDQGLADEAREILETVLIAYPRHPRAQAMMDRLEGSQAGSQNGTGEGRDAFDLAAELADELDELGGDSAPAASSSSGSDDFQYSVEEVFSEFKKGLEKLVKPEDVETHYDLGIAYKEMGLTDDAIGEFVVARQGSVGKKKEVECLTMIGMLQVAKGDFEAAVESFKEGLRTEFSVGEVLKALLYELAAAREAMGQPGKALFHLQKISKMDPKYRDVPNLMNQLAKTASPEDDPVPPGGGGKKMSNGTNGVHGPSRPNGTPSGGSGAASSANKSTDPPSGKNRKVGYL